MKQAKVYYWVDALIGVACIVSALTGAVFLLPVDFLAGDQGGTLGISYALWDTLHVWSSLAIVAGVGGHLLLHIKWIVAMTKKVLAPRRVSAAGHPVPVAASQGISSPGAVGLGRRKFLALGGGVAGLGVLAAGGAALLGLRTVLADDYAGATSGVLKSDRAGTASKIGSTKAVTHAADAAAQPSLAAPVDVAAETAPARTPVPPAAAAERLCVRCPYNLVNDPYPGRCHRYTDRNGDRICDLSIPEPC